MITIGCNCGRKKQQANVQSSSASNSSVGSRDERTVQFEDGRRKLFGNKSAAEHAASKSPGARTLA